MKGKHLLLFPAVFDLLLKVSGLIGVDQAAAGSCCVYYGEIVDGGVGLTASLTNVSFSPPFLLVRSVWRINWLIVGLNGTDLWLLLLLIRIGDGGIRLRWWTSCG